MSFSIIQTIENGKYLLSTVPHKWVNNNTLYWPTNKSTLVKLQKNGHSVPESSWLTYPCIVKKTDLACFDEARQIEKEMLEWSYSESEPVVETYIDNRKKRAIRADTSEKLALAQMYNFNDMFDLQSHSLPVLPVRKCESPKNNNESAFNEPITTNFVDLVQINDDVDQSAVHNNNGPNNIIENEDNNEIISCDITHLNELLKFDFSNFKERLQKLEVNTCQMNAKLDKIIEILKNEQKNENICVSAPDILKSFPFPLNTVEQVEEFESKLLEDNYKKKIISELKRMNGSSGNSDGKKVTYKVIDWLFDRKLLTQYTWTGSSKNKIKKAFLAFKQIIDLIFQIVNCADSKFNLHMTEEFLKINILKYSESRFKQLDHQPSERRSRLKSKVNTDESLSTSHLNLCDKEASTSLQD